MALLSPVLLLLAGCTSSTTTHQLLSREIGRTIADVTLVAGAPQSSADLPDGRRAFHFQRPSLVPTGGPVCLYTVYATLSGRPLSLAAWDVVAVDPPAPGCAPLVGAVRLSAQPATFPSTASQNSAAMSGPPKRFTSRMPVGEVTLISVR